MPISSNMCGALEHIFYCFQDRASGEKMLIGQQVPCIDQFISTVRQQKSSTERFGEATFQPLETAAHTRNIRWETHEDIRQALRERNITISWDKGVEGVLVWDRTDGSYRVKVAVSEEAILEQREQHNLQDESGVMTRESYAGSPPISTLGCLG